ncbi:hypothetical protein K502DRAFT_353969 [Neoconidiobolus thromboides FSU 785]|nr:hypothetical protein K502DRAFT_353969 [Neoconidiobolus thromboides FSU 785]
MKSIFAHTSLTIGLALLQSASAQPLNNKGASKSDISKCFRVDNNEWVNRTDTKVPPCWVENNGKYDCYEYTIGTQCYGWPGIFDITQVPNDGDSPSTEMNVIYILQNELEVVIHGFKTFFELTKPVVSQDPSNKKLSGIVLKGSDLYSLRNNFNFINNVFHPDITNVGIKTRKNVSAFEGKELKEILKGVELACSLLKVDNNHDGKLDELAELTLTRDEILELSRSLEAASPYLLPKSKEDEKFEEPNKQMEKKKSCKLKSNTAKADIVYLVPQDIEKAIHDFRLFFELLKPATGQDDSSRKLTKLTLNGPKLRGAREGLEFINKSFHPESIDTSLKNRPGVAAFEGEALNEILKGLELACNLLKVEDNDHDGKLDELAELTLDKVEILRTAHSIEAAYLGLLSKMNGSNGSKETKEDL